MHIIHIMYIIFLQSIAISHLTSADDLADSLKKM